MAETKEKKTDLEKVQEYPAIYFKQLEDTFGIAQADVLNKPALTKRFASVDPKTMEIIAGLPQKCWDELANFGIRKDDVAASADVIKAIAYQRKTPLIRIPLIRFIEEALLPVYEKGKDGKFKMKFDEEVKDGKKKKVPATEMQELYSFVVEHYFKFPDYYKDILKKSFDDFKNRKADSGIEIEMSVLMNRKNEKLPDGTYRVADVQIQATCPQSLAKSIFRRNDTDLEKSISYAYTQILHKGEADQTTITARQTLSREDLQYLSKTGRLNHTVKKTLTTFDEEACDCVVCLGYANELTFESIDKLIERNFGPGRENGPAFLGLDAQQALTLKQNGYVEVPVRDKDGNVVKYGHEDGPEFDGKVKMNAVVLDPLSGDVRKAPSLQYALHEEMMKARKDAKTKEIREARAAARAQKTGETEKKAEPRAVTPEAKPKVSLKTKKS